MRSHLAATLVALAVVAMLAMGPACAAPDEEIRGAFSRFVAAQNAHDPDVVGELLSDSPDFLWIAPGRVVRGRNAALDRFGELFRSAWRVDPDWSTFEVTMLDVSTAEISVHVSITIGAPARAARMNQILVNTPRGWRVLSIVLGDLPPGGSPCDNRKRWRPCSIPAPVPEVWDETQIIAMVARPDRPPDQISLRTDRAARTSLQR